jgi:hypothetical protein
MIVIAGAILGGSYGGWLARRRGGKPADIAQYAAVYAIVFALVGLFVTVFIDRMG